MLKKPVNEQINDLENKIEKYFTELTDEERKFFLKDLETSFLRYKDLQNTRYCHLQTLKTSKI